MTAWDELASLDWSLILLVLVALLGAFVAGYYWSRRSLITPVLCSRCLRANGLDVEEP